jgi:hypothetical protein
LKYSQSSDHLYKATTCIMWLNFISHHSALISIKSVLRDHLSYATALHCSLGRAHKTGLTMNMRPRSPSCTHTFINLLLKLSPLVVSMNKSVSKLLINYKTLCVFVSICINNRRHVRGGRGLIVLLVGNISIPHSYTPTGLNKQKTKNKTYESSARRRHFSRFCHCLVVLHN